MLSWLGDDYYYDFPEGKPLTKKLKDVLETEVEEKYYLSDKTIKCLNLGLDDKTGFAGGAAFRSNLQNRPSGRKRKP